MLKVSRDSAEHVEQHGPVEDRYQAGDGYTINFLSFGAGVDGTPLLKGLPNDSCHCPHWGYVLKGRVSYRIDGGEDISVEAGDAFYLPPGHAPVVEAGTEFVQFSPTALLDEVSQTMSANFERMQGAGAPG
jgi:mannose-6-phosphate isomerase-like protein (cupin superfamily)